MYQNLKPLAAYMPSVYKLQLSSAVPAHVVNRFNYTYAILHLPTTGSCQLGLHL